MIALGVFTNNLDPQKGEEDNFTSCMNGLSSLCIGNNIILIRIGTEYSKYNLYNILYPILTSYMLS